MGKLKDTMDSDMRLGRFAEGTRRQYLNAAKQFVAFHMKSPEEMGEQEIREYLHHLVEERKVGPSTQKMALAAVSFLYTKTLGRPEEVARIPRPKVESKLAGGAFAQRSDEAVFFSGDIAGPGCFHGGV